MLLGILCTIHLVSAQYPYQARNHEIEDLNVETEYRSLKLFWQYPKGPEPAGFTISLCEQTSWRLKQPCKQRFLTVDSLRQKGNVHDVLKRLSRRHYEADIYQLRTMTNYSISVEPTTSLRTHIYFNPEFGRSKYPRPRFIHTTTKGFAARATRCLGNSTDIEVQTGPYFAGKISVEEVQDDRCAIYGDENSSKETYTLTIPHKTCGSKKVNNSRIETPVLVHENRDLVTHNSRRFLVVCNFVSDSFTVKASVEVPNIKATGDTADRARPIGHSVMPDNPNEIYDDRYNRIKHNSVKDSRFLAEQAAVVHKTSLKRSDPSGSTQLLATVFLSSVFVIIFIGAMLWLAKTSRSLLCSAKIQHAPPSTISIPGDSQTIGPPVHRDDEATLMEDCSLPISYIEPLNDEKMPTPKEADGS